MSREQEFDLSSLTLPPIPKGWGYMRLEDLLEPDGLSYGIVQPGSEDVEGVPVLRVKDLQNGIQTDDVIRVSPEVERQYRRSRLRGGEVLLSLVGSVGSVAVAPPHIAGWNVARAIAVIRVRDQSNHWVKYYLSSELAQRYMHVWKTTTVQATLNLRDVRRLPVALPPHLERDAIVTLLAALDDKIMLNSKIRAKSSALISSLYERALNQSSIPVSLNEAVKFEFGAPFSSDFFNDLTHGMPLLRIRDLRTYRPAIWTTERIAGDVVVDAGDVVAGMDAEFRSTFWLGQPSLLNQRVFRAHSRTLGGAQSFVREVLRAPLLEIERHKTGTTVIHLNKRDLERVTVEVPATAVLQEFEAAANPLRLRLISAARESSSLTELRDALLPRLMSGEIRVRDAERIVEGAT